MVKKSDPSKVRVVPLQGTDTGVSPQELSALEEVVEIAVGRGNTEDRKNEELLHDLRSFCG
jgi:hypothetical protein